MDIIQAQKVLKMPYPKNKEDEKFYWSEIAEALQVHLENGICPNCSSKNDVKRRRTRTQYADDQSNFLISCIDCFKENDKYWKAMFDEIYADQMESVYRSFQYAAIRVDL